MARQGISSAKANGGSHPLVAVRDQVQFPGMIMTLMVSRPATLSALDTALAGDQLVVVLLQRDSSVENPLLSDLYSVGILSEVLHVVPLPDGSSRAVLRGVSRVSVGSLENGKVSYAPMAEIDGEPLSVLASRRILTECFAHLAGNHRLVPPESLDSLTSAKSNSAFADAIAFFLPCPALDKQTLLEQTDVGQRLSALIRLAKQEENLISIEQEIRDQVDSEIGRAQRQFFLKEQLRAIQGELAGKGQSETDRFEELSQNLPPKVNTATQIEIRKLRTADPDSAEAQTSRTYLETVLSLPWNDSPNPTIDLKRAKAALDANHYGLDSVKERMIEFLAVHKLNGSRQGSVLCFVGPPGVGKTSVAHTIADVLGRPVVNIALGGLKDEAEIRGHRRTYVGSRMGKIMNAIRTAGAKNPVCILDEIDKMHDGAQGDPASALLEVLDAEQNCTFVDHYLEVPFDLSEVLFIATANLLDRLPSALLDRLEVIEFSGYSEAERVEIAKRHILPATAAGSGLNSIMPPLTEEATRMLSSSYCREAGVRGLTRECKRLARKLATLHATDQPLPSVIGVDELTHLMGPAPIDMQVSHASQVGTAHGLVVTGYGGDIMQVEVGLARPLGQEPKLTLTGALGPVMQESVQTALTFVRSQLDTRQIDSKFDVHLHLPQAAIPKDGPSAGITIAIALFSAFTGRPASGKVAMTGEITLRGQVLPVGGLREKILAAKRFGYDAVLYPAMLQGEVERMSVEVLEGIALHPISRFDEALEHSFNYAQTVSIL